MALETPAELHAVAAEVQGALSVGEQAAPNGSVEVRIGEEPLHFPYRTYYLPSRLKQVVDSFDEQARAWSLAMCTRHWDGHVREWAARELEPTSYPWARAFAVQLLGEYVVEIARVVEDKISSAGIASYLSFAKENPAFLATTKRRATSYWDCYYRSQYKNLAEFPNFRAVSTLQAAALSAA